MTVQPGTRLGPHEIVALVGLRRGAIVWRWADKGQCPVQLPPMRKTSACTTAATGGSASGRMGPLQAR